MIGPVLKYPGAKWRLADWIIAHMPRHEVYVEPFFGSGAVFFRKDPCRLETINDAYGDVVNLFRVLRDSPDELARLVELTPWSREEYELSYDREESLGPVERARRFLVRTWQGHGSAADQYKNGWRVVRASEKAPTHVPYRQWRDNLPPRIAAAAARLKGAQIESRPAVEVIGGFRRPEVLVYADPPYVSSTMERRKGRKVYEHEMTDEEHEELLAVLAEHPGSVLLSGYDHPIYRRMEGEHDWVRASKRALAEKGQVRTEVLWINPVAAKALGGRLF
ncbi:DNA adenine methylase [Rubrobacter marinus]|uniref:DNA adenine methylase n=1 Tax=Rubrobacter marinus TaxID=2653852 RepID=UPI001A9F214F|nr:DNA adenine methylase [Rubrobacter marinus]